MGDYDFERGRDPFEIAKQMGLRPAAPRAPVNNAAQPAPAGPDPMAEAQRLGLRPQTADDKPGYAETAIRGGLQGVTLGNSDEIGGALQAAIDKAMGDARGYQELYHRHRDEIRAKNEAARAANPATYIGSEIAGGLAVPVPGLGMGAGIARTALGAAALGVGAGIGYNEDPNSLAKDALIGGATGGAAGVAGHAIGAAATSKYATDALDSVGIRFGRTHLAGHVTPFAGGSVKTPISEEAVRAAHEAGAFGGRNVGDSYKVLKGAADEAGNAVKGVVGDLTEQGARSGDIRAQAQIWRNRADQIESSTLGDPRPKQLRAAADELESKLAPYVEPGEAAAAPLNKAYQEASAARQAAYDKVYGEYGGMGGPGRSYNAAGEEVVPQRDVTARKLAEQVAGPEPIAPEVPHGPTYKPASDVPLALGEQLKTSQMQAPGAKRGKLEAGLLAQEERLMGTELRSINSSAVNDQFGIEAQRRFEEAKSGFAHAAEARNAAKVGAARVENRPMYGMGEMLMAAGGHPAGVVATHLMKTRGYGALAGGLMSTAKKLTMAAQTAPGSLGKYAGVLQRAALAGGEEEVAKKHFVLNATDPAYRQMVAGITKGSGDGNE